MISLNQVRRALSLAPAQDAAVNRFQLDSRSLQPCDIFVAIEGERVDGHRFVQAAFDAGVLAVLANPQRVDPTLRDDPRILKVQNPAEALLQVASAWRDEISAKVLAITGSNGKTSTKDVLQHLLQNRQVGANTGNLNSTLGAPLAFLNECKHSHEFYIMEMGASKPGEIARICEACRPDYGMITNIGPAHLEAFGSLDGVALAKRELWAWLQKSNGAALVNADDSNVSAGMDAFLRRSSYSLQSGETGAPFAMEHLSMDKKACAQVRLADELLTLPVPGWAFLSCAFSAVAYAGALGLSAEEIAKHLATVPSSPGRMHVRQQAGWTLLDDCYNANPDSMKAALRTLATMQVDGRRLAFFGPMQELGEHAYDLHVDLGLVAAAAGLDQLILIGDSLCLEGMLDAYTQALGRGGLLVPSIEAAQSYFDTVGVADCVLVKGSRSSHLEELFVGVVL